MKKEEELPNEQPEANAEGNTEETVSETIETTASEPASELEQLKIDKAEMHDKYIRLYSEFENFKRRTAKEKIELIEYAGRDIIVSLLPVVDDFDRAIKSVEMAADITAVKEGIELISGKFKNILDQRGLKPIESIGQEFNIDFHEAITNIPVEDEAQKGKVIDEVERGYILGDKVIRFAKVVVGN
ncbi:MAG: nucleotide exchange factor GrpE [Bacteroidota bacterium]|nr:nucleotide exchange factor GrpE [Bacteroidota bacterium]